MINVLLGVFYIALVALVSYLLYYIIKTSIKDALYEIELIKETESVEETYENTDLDE